MSYDVTAVRDLFPSLADGTAYFDGPGGSQVPTPVAAAVAGTLTAGLANRGSVTAAEQRADAVVSMCRRAMADLLGADRRGIVFGRSMTQLTFDVSRTLAQGWGPGDEVVVTRLDHDANIRPWVIAAERAGARVRWLGFDPVTAELDDVGPLLNERTRLVAVTAASNLFGTRPDVPAITAAAHAVGALTYVDAVHLVPHAPVDKTALGADFLACSPYKFLGPHCGVLAADPELLETLHPDKLLPSTDAVPERFELGTLPYELMAGTTAAVDVLTRLGLEAIEAHEDALLTRLLDGLAAIDGVTVHGSPKRRTPTVLLSVAGREHADVHRALAARRINAPAASFYALEASRHAGLGDAGGLRVGLAPYTNDDEIDRLLAALSEIAAGADA
ncbi:cysteine desulfurase-like protein [Nocardioides sp. CFH 31398]|uniref:cysteine desulfurase-like protein n=1 Tax=Nocardioides sp. CFH 31398 TaxID=2919579 RepID=UPI001F06B6A3|nr:cysteine desulfurase-like protein [Nocardioides sp. CFH 31398]MCH1868094.1 cysteine desulfurase-like protein [Nocardioides sp. CFH 31398]